jgi:hypothetical protein
MTREDILKELELWPLWTLKQVLPVPVSVLEALEVFSQERIENTVLVATIVEVSLTLKAFESEDGLCLMLHASQDFTQEEETLWANICKAMGVNTTLIQRDLPIKDLLNMRSPAVIIIFGEDAAQTMLQSNNSIDDLRSTQHGYHEIPAIVTYDLKHLLQQLQDKGKAWDDLRSALKLMAT